MAFECKQFEGLLEEFLEGQLPPEVRRSAEEHLRACARCHELVELAGTCVDPPGGLADAVLRATTGRTCETARTELCGLVDGELDGVDAELVRMHMQACADCTSLAHVLVALAADLPSCADLQPDERFAGDVLARTLPFRTRMARRAARWVAGWRQVIRRPRFAWEGAYVMTVFMALVLGVHNWPLAGAPKKAYDVATHDLPSRLERPISKLGSTVSSGARTAWESTGGPLADDARTAVGGVSRFSTNVVQMVKSEVGTFWSRLASQQVNDDDDNRSTNDEDRREGDDS